MAVRKTARPDSEAISRHRERGNDEDRAPDPPPAMAEEGLGVTLRRPSFGRRDQPGLTCRRRPVRLVTAAAPGFIGSCRADYDKLVALDQPLGIGGLRTAARANGVDLVHLFGHRQQLRHRPKRYPPVIHVEAGHDHPFAEVGQVPAHPRQPIVEELRLIDAHDLRPGVETRHDLVGAVHELTGHPHLRVGNDIPLGVAVVELGFEDLDPLPGDHRPFEKPNQLLRLARKHRAGDYLDPARTWTRWVHQDAPFEGDRLPGNE